MYKITCWLDNGNVWETLSPTIEECLRLYRKHVRPEFCYKITIERTTV